MNGTVLQRRKIAGARHLGAAVLALLVLGMPASGSAQARVTGADLEGVVKDESGDVLAGAVVTIVNTDTDCRPHDRDRHGRPVPGARPCPSGTYSIRIDRAGFAALRRDGIVLLLGQSACSISR